MEGSSPALHLQWIVSMYFEVSRSHCRFHLGQCWTSLEGFLRVWQSQPHSPPLPLPAHFSFFVTCVWALNQSWLLNPKSFLQPKQCPSSSTNTKNKCVQAISLWKRWNTRLPLLSIPLQITFKRVWRKQWPKSATNTKTTKNTQKTTTTNKQTQKSHSHPLVYICKSALQNLQQAQTTVLPNNSLKFILSNRTDHILFLAALKSISLFKVVAYFL